MEKPVKDYISELDTNSHRAVQILHLLNPTSKIAPEPGLLGEPNPNGWWEYRFLYDGEKEKSAKWIKAILTGPLHGVRGRKRMYSTAGYILLGEIIARVSGIPYEEYVTERGLKPLGMHATYFQLPEHLHEKAAVADQYKAALINLKRSIHAEPPRSGTGIYSTLDDLSKLGQMLLNRGRSEEGQHIVGSASIDWLVRNDWMGIPGLLWANVNEDHFPLGERDIRSGSWNSQCRCTTMWRSIMC